MYHGVFSWCCNDTIYHKTIEILIQLACDALTKSNSPEIEYIYIFLFLCIRKHNITMAVPS